MTDPFLAPEPPRVSTGPAAFGTAAPGVTAASSAVRGRDVPGWAVALIVVGGLVLWAPVAAAVAIPSLLGVGLVSDEGLGSGDFAWPSEGDGAPPVDGDAVALDDAVPAAWVTVTSPSGRMTFAVDPAWEDMGGDDPASFTDAEQQDLWELVGSWSTAGGGYVTIDATHDYTYAWPVQEDAEWYLDPVGEYDSSTVEQRAVVTDAGYAGYEIVAQADDAGYEFEECVMVLDTGSSSIYIYAQVEGTAGGCADLTRPIAQSILVD